MIEDAELIARAQAGDAGAFTELVRRHDRAVFALAARFVSSAEDAKDIYQDVMVRVYRGLAAFRQESSFSTWLHRITVNVCLSHRDRRGQVNHIPLDSADDSQEEATGPVSRERAPDDSAMAAETAGHIRRALEALSPQQRMVFMLRHYEGHSLKEIAAALRCSEGTVKRYLFVATRRMRDELRHLL
jgi:RNA polymerase sigma-70 factor (ECF subfamily)